MRFLRMGAPFAAGALLAFGCQTPEPVGTSGGTGGTATATASSSSTTTTTATSSSSSSGAGGASSSSSSTGSSSGGGGAGGGGGALEPSGFSCSATVEGMTNVVAITKPNCSVGAGCHVAMAAGPQLYNQFVNRFSEECGTRLMVAPGDPEHSYVINKITDKNLCGGVSMPNGKPLLSAADVQVIYDWICEGAPKQ